MSIQQMFLGAGGAADPTYLEKIFSTYLYLGNNGSKTINNGIDLAGEGGLVWLKVRNDNSKNSYIYDTVTGIRKALAFNTNGALQDYTGAPYNSKGLLTFTSTGFTMGENLDGTNDNNKDHAAFTFRKQKGFFDLQEFSGHSSSFVTVNHDLGAVPGLIIYKRKDSTSDWLVWHSDFDENDHMRLNEAEAKQTSQGTITEQSASSVKFNVNTSTSAKYIAYFFGGGESQAATARSVYFGTSSNWLNISDSSDWDLGQTFTIEAWIKVNDMSSYSTIIRQYQGTASGTSWFMRAKADGAMQFYDYTDAADQVNSATGEITEGTWTHIALVNNSGTAQWYINGVASGDSKSFSPQGGANGDVNIGSAEGSGDLDGYISNLRVVKGSAVYTSNFTPPIEPLTNITNTVLLCCNNSSVTGSTVTPGTIGVNSGYVGSPTAKKTSPFDDPAGFIFGESADQNVIKCGSYEGNGSTDGPIIHLGWEPQSILIKNTEGSDNWEFIDCWRGMYHDYGAQIFKLNTDNQETADTSIRPLANGFQIKNSGGSNNDNGSKYIYMAIRRPGGKASEPVTAASQVFAMDTGNASSLGPCFDTGGFPVDMAWVKRPDLAHNMSMAYRLEGPREYNLTSSGGYGGASNNAFDKQAGWRKGTGNTSDFHSWMWHRAHGFMDVVYYDGAGAERTVQHNLGVVPEMFFLKRRDGASSYVLYHKGMNGGVNPEQYFLQMSDTNGFEDNTYFQDKAPTANEFYVSNILADSGDNWVATLFASIDGVCKVGSYATTSAAAVSVTLGFQPRFLWIKDSDETGNGWFLFDSLRGLGTSGNNPFLQTNTSAVEDDSGEQVLATSTGFTISASNTNSGIKGTSSNPNGVYIYYAIA